MLVIFATHLIRQAVWRSPGRTAAAFDLSDLLLCSAVLVFIACHYRLQSLTLNVVPLDPRRRQGRPRWVWWRLRRLPALEPHGRSPSLVTATEIITLLIWLPLCVFLAQLLWMGLGRQWMFYNFPPHISRIMAAGGGLGLGILIVSGLYRFWGHRHMTPTAAALFLQDTLWRETRREQRRHLRWLAWRSLRAKEKR